MSPSIKLCAITLTTLKLNGSSRVDREKFSPYLSHQTITIYNWIVFRCNCRIYTRNWLPPYWVKNLAGAFKIYKLCKSLGKDLGTSLFSNINVPILVLIDIWVDIELTWLQNSSFICRIRTLKARLLVSVAFEFW